MSGKAIVTLIGKVERAPQVNGGITRVYLNVPEFNAKKQEWTPNVILVRIGGKAAEDAANLKPGARILVEGELDQLKWKVDDKNRSMLTVLAYGFKQGGPDNYNCVVLLGRVGVAPNVKWFEGGNCLTEIVMAHDRYQMAAAKGERGTNVTCWTDIKIIGKRAEAAGNFLGKGKTVLIKGILTTDTWVKDGVTQSRTYVKAFDFTFAGGREEGDSMGASGEAFIPEAPGEGQWEGEGGDGGYGPGPDYDNEAHGEQRPQASTKPAGNVPDLDDEIPC
jgi:single-strand DNA-binding protein